MRDADRTGRVGKFENMRKDEKRWGEGRKGKKEDAKGQS